MSWKRLNSAGLCLGAMMIFAGSALWAQAASSTSKSTKSEDSAAARLLREVRSDAAQVQTAAAKLDDLTSSSTAKWTDYDRQWNIMKPAVEDMQIRVSQLEKMEASLSAGQRSEVDQSKQMVARIQARTHELRTLLDKNGVQTSDSKFKLYATSLKRDSSKLERQMKTS